MNLKRSENKSSNPCRRYGEYRQIVGGMITEKVRFKSEVSK